MKQTYKDIDNRKTLVKMLLVQWSKFTNVPIELAGSTLFTGVNGTGKSTILDAFTYVLTGNTQFNKAAKDRDRTVASYVRGDTRSEGEYRYLRKGQVISYIALEFWSPSDNDYFIVGVCIESVDENSAKSSWFIKRKTRISDVNFYNVDGRQLTVTPKAELEFQGIKMKSADFMPRDKGVEQVLRALGLRCKADTYRSKLLKMMAFTPENNINKFIRECVLEPVNVTTLSDLRQQKEKFDEIKEVYERLLLMKSELGKIEKQIINYENNESNIHLKEIMLAYQKLEIKKKEELENKITLKKINVELDNIKKESRQAADELTSAQKRLEIANTNCNENGLKRTLDFLEQKMKELAQEIINAEHSLANILHLQEKINKLFPMVKEDLDFAVENKHALLHIASPDIADEEKYDAFIRFRDDANSLNQELQTRKVHKQDEKDSLLRRKEELVKDIKNLKNNKNTFTKEAEIAKQLLQQEFERSGIQTEVRLFAELVKAVKKPEWQDALEVFLGRKKYFLVVEEKYCLDAMKIMKKNEFQTASLIVTDKLPETKIAEGSAAEILEIPNPLARRYANYLLNGIHLCYSTEELHEYPLGGLTKDGRLAKGYAVSYLNMNKNKIQYCLGEKAITLQLAANESELAAVERKEEDVNKTLEELDRKLIALKEIDWRVEAYDLGAAKRCSKYQAEKTELFHEKEKIESDPEFIALLKEQKKADELYQTAVNQVMDISARQGKTLENRKTCEEAVEKLEAEIHIANKDFQEIAFKYLELKRKAIEEYEHLVLKKPDGIVISEKTIQNLRKESEKIKSNLETLQIEYCKLAKIDIEKRGVSFIPFYRKEYSNISDIKAEETRQLLEEKQKNLESAFMNDFVAEIIEAMERARADIEEINKELKRLPFGRDIYTFRLKERPDKAAFFRIAKKMENYMNNLDLYQSINKEDEELEDDIQTFMEIIMDGGSEEEYADYRSYFMYDMEIRNKDGNNEIKTDLSRKQGSASNGEKQTPYFIILAASLMQCYPREACCARLVFVDEAFSALSRERIEQMVTYFEQNNFQVMYAAPPEKINSIGSYIDSTVSLVETGRYTNVVEGLVGKFGGQ